MQHLALLLVLLAGAFAVGHSAPAQQQEEFLDDLITETQNLNAKQETLKTEAEIEQNTLRGLFGSVLNGANNYAQTRLNPRAEQPSSLKQLLGSFINGANNYAQRRLLNPKEALFAALMSRGFKTFPSQFADSMSRTLTFPEEATIEQQNLIMDLITGYLRSKLDEYAPKTTPDSEAAPAQFAAPMGRRFPTQEEATIEQQNLRELRDLILSSLRRYLRSKLDEDTPETTPDPQLEDLSDLLATGGGTAEEMEANEQAISSIILPILTSLASRFLTPSSSPCRCDQEED